MAESFATVPELQGRLEWTLSTDESRIALGVLEDLSEEARFYGRNWLTAAAAPRMIRTIVLKAAQRHMRNTDGYTQSRAGDEAVAWSDRGQESGSASLTEVEIKMIQRLVRPNGLTSVEVVSWDTSSAKMIAAGYSATDVAGYVPVAGGGDPFPLYPGAGPW